MALPDHVAELVPAVRHVGARAQADLQRRQDGRLARAVLPVDEVHVGAERDAELAVAHEVLAVDLDDDTHLRRLACRHTAWELKDGRTV